MRKKSVLPTAAAAVAAAGVALFGGGPATAATSQQPGATPAAAAAHTVHTTGTDAAAAGYGGQCGSGYKPYRSGAVGDFGTVYLTHNDTKRKSCVVTVRKKSGAPVWMSASITPRVGARDQQPVVDSGHYRSYAGPVYVHGVCVDFTGVIEDEHYSEEAAGCDS